MSHCGCENSSCLHGTDEFCHNNATGKFVVDYLGAICPQCAAQYHADGIKVYQRDARTGAFLPYGGNK